MANLIFNFSVNSQGGGSPPGVDGDAPYQTSTSRGVGGQSVTFSSAIEHGVYGNGFDNNMWMKPGTIAAYTPGFAASGYWGGQGNGAMKNVGWLKAWGDNDSELQGWVGRNPSAAGTNSPGSQAIGYAESQRDGVPITMQPGDCLVIAKSRTTQFFNGATPKNYSPERFLFVHCVADRPYADSFAPPYVWPDGDRANLPHYRYSDIDLSQLPRVGTSGFLNPRPAAASLVPSADGLPALRILDVIPYTYRNNLTQTDGGPETWTNLWGGNFQPLLDRIYAYICSDASNADKAAPLKYVLQRAIDTYGIVANAKSIGQTPYNSDGGWNVGRLGGICIGGHLLGDATMRDFLKNNYEPDRITFPEYVGDYHMRGDLTPGIIDATQVGGWDGHGAGSNNIPYVDVMGQAPAVPEWAMRMNGSGLVPSQINNIWDNAPNAYRNTGQANATSGEAAALELMGLRGAWGHDAWLNYQARYHAMLHYGDDPWRYVNGNPTPRYAYMVGAPTGTSNPANFQREIYDKAVFDGFTYPAGVNAFNP